MNTKNTIIEKAIAVVGSQKELARRIGGKVKQQHIHRWLYLTKCLPAERAIQIEIATDGAVTRYELRPDLWPPPPEFEPQPASASPEDRRRNPPNAVCQKTGEAGGTRTAGKPRKIAGSGEAAIEQAA